MVKYIFVTGGVCSSLGKGLTSASIGTLLEKQGMKIAMMKFDPYLNIDPGTMSPFEHGEVFVLDDGGEMDLDFGHYSRLTNASISKASNITSGQVYSNVIRRERRGDYLGKTVQVIPHVTDEIKKRIADLIEKDPSVDILLIEVGGTAGDIESLPFLEAIRQFRQAHPQECMNLHLTYVPFLNAAGEFKTKPSQHSVQVLRGIGLFPDVLVCRCEKPLSEDVKAKLSLFCNVPKSRVIEEADVKNSIYELPSQLHQEGIDKEICAFFSLPYKKVDLSEWDLIVDVVKNPKGKVRIGIVGKYVLHQDAYKSVYEALHHAAIANGISAELVTVESDKNEKLEQFQKDTDTIDAVLVPGGFGERGWEGKIQIAKFCREKKIPYFGICLGMQVMAVEFARHAAGLIGANSTEIDPSTPYPVISLLSEQKHVEDFGGTMRLGSSPCTLVKESLAYKAYGKQTIHERHRHRYEFNNRFLPQMKEKGFRITGTYEKADLCEIVEIPDHPWMVGVQFHPEFLSKPTAAHPLFSAFIEAAMKRHEGKKDEQK